MANPEHVEIVRQGAEAIKEFREKNPDVRFDLNGADLRHANLRHANLREADLQHARLDGAILINADLCQAVLHFASLYQCNLRDATLINANLEFANLSQAKLSGADLRHANLKHANLNEANLNEAKLNNAFLRYTVFANVDLSQAIGLESVTHVGPSTIGVDALFLSNGKIPDVFLRGCGLPEEFIPYVPSFVGSAIEFYSCFISYNNGDKQFARQLHDRLQGKGIRCWLDEKELIPGQKLYDGIDRGIRVWDKVLLCASKDSLNSWWVDNEISIALSKERKLLQETQQEALTIIPLDLDGYMFSDEWKKGYRQQVLDRVAADFTNWKTDADEFERQFERVVKALRTDGGKLPDPKPKLPKQ